MDLKLNYNVPIVESAQINGDFLIQGIAINSTTTGNNHKFLAEELEPAAVTLKGVPLLVDHNNSVDSIKGRVVEGMFDQLNKNIKFEAKVVDQKIREMINDGRLNSVSVGAAVKDIEEGEDGTLIPRGIQFKELILIVTGKQNLTFHH